MATSAITLLGYFAISGENVFHKILREHKRSSGRQRYPSPIQVYVAISCCASSKDSLDRQHSLREQGLRALYVIGDAN